MNRPVDTELLTSSVAEQALIGSIVYFGDRITELDTVIEMLPTSAMFSDATYRDVWDAILTVHNSNLNVSKMTVAAELESKGHRHPDIELGAIIDELQATSYSPELITYAEQVSTNYKRLELVKLGCKLQLIKVTDDVSEVITKTIESTLDRILGLSTSNEGRWLTDIVVDKCLKLESCIPLYDADSALRSRIGGLDALINGGLFPGHFIVIAAPPSGGKTSLSLDIAEVNAMRGKRTMYYCPDETENSIGDRALIAGTALPKWRFGDNQFLESEMDDIIKTRQAFEEMTGDVMVVPNIRGITEIMNHAKRQQRKHGVDLIVVDYIQQVTPAQGRRYSNRTDEMTSVAEGLKVMAKTLNVPVIGVSQYSRQRSGGQVSKITNVNNIPHPKMEWLRDSGAIEQEANIVIATQITAFALRAANGREDTLTTEEFNRSGEAALDAQLHVLKNKEGGTGTVPCKFNAFRMRFYEEVNAGPEPVEVDHYDDDDGRFT